MKKKLLTGGAFLIILMGWTAYTMQSKENIIENREATVNREKGKGPQGGSSLLKEKEPLVVNGNNVPKKTVLVDTKKDQENIRFQKNQEIVSKRLLRLEQHKQQIQERNRYRKARVKWRKSLNAAYKEAKKSGDYSKYELIKSLEPGKN